MEQIEYQAGYKYQLYKTYTTQLQFVPHKEIHTRFIFFSATGELTIMVGYAWDGPSGPTIDTKNFMRGSLVHDALYQLMREGLLPEHYRIFADMELRRICLEDKMCALRAAWVYKAVRDFGSSSAALGPDPVYIAPALGRFQAA